MSTVKKMAREVLLDVIGKEDIALFGAPSIDSEEFFEILGSRHQDKWCEHPREWLLEAVIGLLGYNSTPSGVMEVLPEATESFLEEFELVS